MSEPPYDYAAERYEAELEDERRHGPRRRIGGHYYDEDDIPDLADVQFPEER